MKVAILYSGGLDSLILRRWAQVHAQPGDVISSVWWDHGHPAAAQERATLPAAVSARRVDWLQLDVAGKPKAKPDQSQATNIPGRNLALAVLTACQELPDEIWLGSLANEDHARNLDRNPIFRALTGAALSYVLGDFLPGIRVRVPLAEAGLDKFGEVEWALAHDLTQAELVASWSCFRLDASDSRTPCGWCGQCVRRHIVFGVLGFTEATEAHPLRDLRARRWLTRLLEPAMSGAPDLTDLRGWFGDDARWLPWLEAAVWRENVEDGTLVRAVSAARLLVAGRQRQRA